MANDPHCDAATAWDSEYERRGIPSSHRDGPSGVVRWALSNVPFLTDDAIAAAVDLGCGTGRNAIALADAVNFIHGDVTRPLPFGDGSFDLATDVSVYFHQLADAERAACRREIRRILKPDGILLVSMATSNDGYYFACGTGPLAGIDASVRLTWDPVAGVGNILPSYDQLMAEFSDLFELRMSWLKQRNGPMHGKPYRRETAATLWAAK
jgi:SAM-dependent methyltransferase